MSDLAPSHAVVLCLCVCVGGCCSTDGRRNSSTHMLFEHQVLHSLHDKLGAGVHHSGKKAAEEMGGETGEEDRVRLVVSLR